MTAPVAEPTTASIAPSSAMIVDAGDLRALHDALGGGAIVDGDAAFESARFAHNLLFDRRPAVIVKPSGALEVSRAVLAARELGLEIAVRGGGHSLAGHSTTDGGLLIDLSAMRDVEIDPVHWTGTAQGGATAGEYTVAASRHGFATPFGDTGSVGLGGLTLGGGIGWLARKHGMTIDSLLEVDLVTADGELRSVSEASDPDLFWAVRGGGGNFGIATRFHYRLHPVATVTGGILALPLSAQLLRDLVDASMEAPEELTQITFVMGLPPAPFVPAEMVGMPAVMMMPVYAGDPDAGAAAMAPFRKLATPLVDMVRPMPYAGMYELTAGATIPVAEVIRSTFMGELDAVGAEAIVELHRSPAGAASMTQLRVLGGAMGRVPAGATAFAHRDAPVLAAVIGGVPGTREEAESIADGVLAQLRPASTGVYSNFVADEGEARVREAYPAATYERLVAVKRRVDPTNVFRANQNIRP
jgi:FAD/FMN-containing dehydrogenase